MIPFLSRLLLRLLLHFETLIWLLLIALALTIISAMGMLVRGLNYPLLVMVTLGGLLVGGLLARIRAPWWLALSVMMGTGFEIIVLLVGNLLPKIWALLRAIMVYLFLLWQENLMVMPNIEPVQSAGEKLFRGGSVVLTRLWIFLGRLGAKGILDPLPIQFIWGWVLWITIAWTAFMIWQNRQAVIAVIPLGILLTVAMFFTGIDSNTLLIFLFLTLVLQAANSWKRRQQRWENRNMDWATDIAQDVAIAAGAVIGISIFFSALIPEISIPELFKRLQPPPSAQQQKSVSQPGESKLVPNSRQRVDEIAASLGIDRRVTPTPSIDYRPPAMPGGLPQRHLLQAGQELSKIVVMLVKTSDPPPPPPEAIQYINDISIPALYWMAVTFDQYNGRGWSTSNTTFQERAPDELQLEPQGPGRVITQTTRLINPFGYFLFTAGFPIRVDQPTQIKFRSHQDWAGTALKTYGGYTAQSWQSEATPEQLRAAGAEYPDWIIERYLNLPDSVPNRVRSLARELTATAPTPYDRAVALENFLRTYPYTLDVPIPPANRDVVDYFLFDLQKGYCDYYASGMVVLARAAGLPARFVIGYAPSPFDHATGQYVVRKSEAHSWAQIYFPNYGWIDFEPTGGRSALDREGEGGSKIAGVPTLPPDYNIDDLLAGQLPWWKTVPLWKIMVIGLAGIGSVLLLGMGITQIRDLHLKRQPAHHVIPVLQGRLERRARWLGVSASTVTTPLELQAALIRRLEFLAQKQPRVKNIVPLPADIAKLVQAFVGLRYSPHPISDEQGRTCFQIWRRVRWRLWGLVLATKLGYIRG